MSSKLTKYIYKQLRTNKYTSRTKSLTYVGFTPDNIGQLVHVGQVVDLPYAL